jgi:hypothetical protein
MNEQFPDELLVQRVADALNAEADAAFPEERLTRQRSKILQQLQQIGRPGRVIAFPAQQGGAPHSILQTTPATRWIAAAAAAAFIAGLVAGQRLPSEFRATPNARVAVSRPAAAAPTGSAARPSTPVAVSDDEFLSEVELAANSRPAVLRHLDALTPRAWDVGQ